MPLPDWTLCLLRLKKMYHSTLPLPQTLPPAPLTTAVPAPRPFPHTCTYRSSPATHSDRDSFHSTRAAPYCDFGSVTCRNTVYAPRREYMVASQWDYTPVSQQEYMLVSHHQDCMRALRRTARIRARLFRPGDRRRAKSCACATIMLGRR
jgi:hypothetical protein